ncbi:TKL/TKL-ccin protein kinase [Mycena venus]|uniref:TKL/TKL-ccin protein kinase n=1 Tax=Mycena venus TaxID=2733690 RepID=A0A8H6X9B0_9AGAR|nr:TKL/TKL-ccin protein kinase [Mycena venus]
MRNNLAMVNEHNGLPSNLYDLQLKSSDLVSDFHFRFNEVVRIAIFPGLYLGREKVAIKIVRAVSSNENSLRVKGVARGPQVLHSMNPPVVYGDLKASNIVIGAVGNPLIADFGLSWIVEDSPSVGLSE